MLLRLSVVWNSAASPRPQAQVSVSPLRRAATGPGGRSQVTGFDTGLPKSTTSRLVGVSRAITDYAWCTYLSDLAVDRAHQRQGIGRELIRRTHEAAGLHTGTRYAVTRRAWSASTHADGK